MERQLAARRQTRRHHELHNVVAFDDTVQFLPDAVVCNAGGRECINVGAFSMIAGNISTVTAGARLAIGDHCFVGVEPHLGIRADHDPLICLDLSSGGYPRRRWSSDRLGGAAGATRQLLEGRGVTDYGSIEKRSITIEDDVWIGFKSTILKGVTIGRGAIIAAASLVTTNVEPFTLVAGNPARVVRTLEASVTT